MKNLFDGNDAIKATLGIDDFNRYTKDLKDGYRLSILTGSHCDSYKYKTVEVALLKDGEFVFGDEDTDESIIHYMSWALFLDFIGDMSSWNEGRADKSIEDIFKYYQDYAERN